MAITVADIQTNLNTYLGDSSTDRISDAERLQAITEATVWIQEDLKNDLQNATFTVDYLDTINIYKTTTAVADLLVGADLRRDADIHARSFAHKSSRELAEEIGQGATESSWGIERRDTNTFLIISHQTSESAKIITTFDSTTAGGGTWSLDTTNGDGTNLTVDTTEKKQGNASLNFDADVSQSVNDKIELVNTTYTSTDLGEFEDLASYLFWAYVPDVTNFTGFTLSWGETDAKFWSASATTDIDGSAFVAGWNEVKVDWADATKTSTPDVTAITYFQVDYDYTGSQGDDTDFRIDFLRLANPEKLTFHYLSWNVGTNSGGTDVTVFGATTDIPYFSGMYDQYKYAVAHKAASILYRSPLRLREEASAEEGEADEAMIRAKKIHPSAKTPEVKSFKVMGVRFPRR